MIKITTVGTQQTNRSAPKKRASSTDSALFSGLLSSVDTDADVAAPAAISQSAPLSSLNPMLALQEMPDDEFQLKQALKKGKSMLDSLEEIRNGLLMGSLPYSSLSKLEQLVNEQRMGTTDPRLQSILDDIELRAAVELAKLDMARQTR